jgi:hypothetical protein
LNKVSLVIMEPGSDWPGHVGTTEELVAFAHDDDELLARTQERLATLRSSGRSIWLAVLACNVATGQVVRERRAALARALLSAVAPACFGRLVLSASASASHCLRGELLSLAGDLMAVAHGAMISLHFAACPGPVSRSFRVAARERRDDRQGSLDTLRAL